MGVLRWPCNWHARSLSVNLWGHQPEHINDLISDGENRAFLPGRRFPDNIHPMADLTSAVKDVEHVLLVIPSKAYREFLSVLSPLISSKTRVFWASKGFEIETGLFLHQLVEELLTVTQYGVISGPTFATEVADNLPAAVTCAGNDQEATLQFARLLHGEHFRCYTSKDIIGVEIGGCAKKYSGDRYWCG